MTVPITATVPMSPDRVIEQVAWALDAGDTETAHALIAEAAMQDDDLAGYFADKYGHKTVAEMILKRANRAMDMIRLAEADLDRALGAIYYIQQRPEPV